MRLSGMHHPVVRPKDEKLRCIEDYPKELQRLKDFLLADESGRVELPALVIEFANTRLRGEPDTTVKKVVDEVIHEIRKAAT